MRLSFLLLIAPLATQAQQYRAFWADAFHSGYKTPAQVDQLIEDMATSRANAVFVEVRRRADSYYHHSLEPPAEDTEYDAAFDALAYLIERAHARSIEVHAWFPVYKIVEPTVPPRNPLNVWNLHGPKASGADMWMTISSKGVLSDTTLDPGHPGVLQYLADVMLEPAKYYDLDGIHLDYIRYPEGADYGWNPTAVARFQRLTGTTVTPDPADPKWSDFRRKQVSDLVRQVYLRAYAIRPSIKISAALITWGSGPANDAEFRLRDAYRFVYQDWRGMLEEGILDLGIPMNYFRDGVAAQAGWFDQWIEYEKDRQYGRGILIGPAIYLNSITESVAQLQRSLTPSRRGNMAMGVAFYSYASTNATDAPNGDLYRAIGEFFGNDAGPPAMPWKDQPTRGHIYGRAPVDSATVVIESAGGRQIRTTADATAFFGAVDLPPGQYRVGIEESGQVTAWSEPQDLNAGGIIRFDLVTDALPDPTSSPLAPSSSLRARGSK